MSALPNLAERSILNTQSEKRKQAWPIVEVLNSTKQLFSFIDQSETKQFVDLSKTCLSCEGKRLVLQVCQVFVKAKSQCSLLKECVPGRTTK